MNQLRIAKDCRYSGMMMALVWILAFQNPLEKVFSPFSYVDEAVALMGALLVAYDVIFERNHKRTKEQWIIVALMAVLAGAGLAGNLIYRYQPLKVVAVDLFTNFKFFLAMGTGYYLFQNATWSTLENAAVKSAKIIMAIVSCVFLADRVMNLYPAEVRYGIKSAVLFYSHPTYLAGSMAFLVAVLTVFFDKKNVPFILMGLALIAFTLRSKAIASAAMYVALFVVFAVLKWKLRLWYIAAAVAVCVLLAWPQIRFYFIELGGTSARSVMLATSLLIMKDYFPIGTGFGTFGSAEAAKNYSPVYIQYKFNENFELRDISDVENTMRLIHQQDWLVEAFQHNPDIIYENAFLNDQFWPIIFGQTGVIGTLAFMLLLGAQIWYCFHANRIHEYAYVGVLFAITYLLIASIAEPAFHNAVAIPLGVVMGIVFREMNKKNTQTDKGEQVCLKRN